MLKFKSTFLLLASYFLILGATQSQILEPVKWDIQLTQSDESTYEIVAKASIEEKWHVYAAVLSNDEEAFGPIPTSIDLDSADNFQLVGSLQDGEYHTAYDPNFDMDLNFFEEHAEFRQKIKITSPGEQIVTGALNYMACDDEKCIFPDPVALKITVSADRKVAALLLGDAATESEDSSSGIYEPASWAFSSVALENGLYQIQMTCTLDEGWHVYSQHLEGDEGPLPTQFAFELPEGFSLEGRVVEESPKTEYDPNFMMELAFFEGTPLFTQNINSNGNALSSLKASVDFMVCNEEMCLPPELLEFNVDLATGIGAQANLASTQGLLSSTIIPMLPSVNLDSPESNCGGEVKEYTNSWTVFLFGFIGGLLALLTPCVFPMIPLTVSFFTKGSGSRSKGIGQALLYGFFIFIIYALLSVPFHFGVEPETLNEIATGVGLNVVFFIVFVVFAISFFGYFELTLPPSMVNKIDSASNVGGIIGIFLMALTLALVSFSCTGPILGTVLGNALKNGPWPITAAMSGFGVALGLPFAVFAMFPSMMKSLPKSGGWLNSVKVVLGFLELALALKFLSNADLVKQWGLIPRETFFLIWTIIFLGLALYLFGLIKFPHDSKTKKASPLGLGLGVIVLAFTIYIAPGVMKDSPWNHNLLSGFPPPTFYSWYEQDNDHNEHQDDKFHPPYDDFEEAMAAAQAAKKPLLIDFTGWACVNCRKMEEGVWTDPVILEKLQNEFVVVSLYVDDRSELPQEQQGVFEYEVNGENKKKSIRTIGNKWATFQTKVFNNNSQPYYVMLDTEGKLLANPVGYTPDVEKYKSYLDCGIQAQNKPAELK